MDTCIQDRLVLGVASHGRLHLSLTQAWQLRPTGSLFMFASQPPLQQGLMLDVLTHLSLLAAV